MEDLKRRAQGVCRTWARVRVELVDEATGRMDEEFVEFDRRMFRLGELVWAAEGEVGEAQARHVQPDSSR